MNKMIRVLLAMAMCFSMAFGATACDLFGPVSSESGSESGSVDGSESGSESESESESESGSADVTPDIKTKLKIDVATAEELAAINATNITDYVNGEAVIVEAAYTFTALETAEEAAASEYANWIADYYVSIDKAIEEDQLGLAGSYEKYEDGVWVAFYAPAVAANEKTALLGSVGGEWTYKDIVKDVNVFKCGVFDKNNACKGATLTVELRLTNPDPEAETKFIVVNSTQYTFAE